MNRRSLSVLVILMLLCILPVGAVTREQRFQASKGSDIFHSILRELNMSYVDTIDIESMIKAGVDAMLSSLDPYTVYYSEADEGELKMMTTGKYAGIGAIIREYPEKGLVAIEEPYEGMSADRDGLRAGDLILRIDGKDMRGKGNSYVSNHLRGVPDSKVVVTVQRYGSSDSLDIVVTRGNIALPPVPYYDIIDGIGYIYLESFTEGSAAKVREIVELFKREHIKGIVLDLRDNGGGLLHEAVDIVSLFVPKGTMVVRTEGKLPQMGKRYFTQRSPILPDMPLVVMVNENSASSSEIVAGVIQDLDRGVIVGKKSYGKGLVQSTVALPYNGALKMTTSRYYIPSGRCIQRIEYRGNRVAKSSASNDTTLSSREYYTVAGRRVSAGGGIAPDIEVTLDTLPGVLYAISSSVALFDFMNEYTYHHTSIAPLKEFEVSDTLLDNFIDYLSKAGFSHQSNSRKALDLLIEMAENDGLADKAKDEFEQLKTKLQYDMEHDLYRFRDDIKHFLGMELASRYYYQRGSMCQALKRDKVFDKAREILCSEKLYQSILSPKGE